MHRSARPAWSQAEKHTERKTPKAPRLVPDLPQNKGVFIPPQRPDTTRTITLSDTEYVRMPMYLVRHDEKSYLVWSGLESSSPEFPGAQIIMPDIRILIPMREHIRAWFLTDCGPETLDGIVPMLVHLDFPMVYAYQNIIDAIRTRLEKLGLSDRLKYAVVKSGYEHETTVDAITFRSFSLSGRSHHSHNSATIDTPNGRILFLDPDAEASQMMEALGPCDLVFCWPAHSLSDTTQERIKLLRVQKCITVNPHETFEKNPAYGVRAQEQFTPLQHGNIVDITEHRRIDVHAVRLYFDTLVADVTGINTSAHHTMQARTQMQTAWAMTVAVVADMPKREITSIRIETRGLAFVHDVHELRRLVMRAVPDIFQKALQTNADLPIYAHEKIIKRELEKAISAKFQRAPVIIPVIFDSSSRI